MEGFEYKTASRRRFRLLAISLVLALSWLLVAAAPGWAGEFTNVVLFARFAGETEDVFNSDSNWTKIDGMFIDNFAQNNLYGSAVNDSFSAYISAISNGQLTVKVLFPQERADGSGVEVFTLSAAEGGYNGDDDRVVRELLAAINDGRISLPDGVKPDQAEAGVLDNLTIIIQGEGENINADPILYPHRNTYSGLETITAQGWNCLVRNFNIIDSASILDGSRAQGVISHEFLHSVGFSDLYRYSGNGDPVGPWDLMSKVGRWQQYPLAYTRAQQGWLELTTVTPAAGLSQELTLDLATLPQGQRCIILKTPLSDTEFFVLEYRRKLSWGGGLRYGFDTKLTDEGLLIYRVNPTVEGKGNQGSEDFLYLFRPRETSLTAAAGEINNAALTPWGTEAATGYGSGDMQATFTENTLFYSDGSNSGIVISDLSAGADGAASEQLTLTVNFPDYSQLDLWRKLGADAARGCYNGDLAFSPGGTPYLAANRDDQLFIAAYADGLWTELPSPGAIATYSAPQLAFLGDTPVLLYLDSDWETVRLKLWNGSGWTQKASFSTEWQDRMEMVSSGDTVTFFYLPDGESLKLHTLTQAGVSNGQTLRLPAGASWITPTLGLYQNTPLVVYAYMDSAWKFSTTQVSRLTDQGWQTMYSGSRSSNMHSLAVAGDRLYIWAGNNDISPTLYSWDGASWTESRPLAATSYTSLAVAADACGVYLGLVENVWQAGLSQAVPIARVYQQEPGQTWTQLSSDICSNVSVFGLTIAGDSIYAPLTTGGNTDNGLKLYRQDLPGDDILVAVENNSAQLTLRSTAPVSGRLLVACYGQGRLLSVELRQVELPAGCHSWTVPTAVGAEEIRSFLLDDCLQPLLAAGRWGD